MRIEPVTTDRLGDLADLFGSNKGTTGCWCMAFISSNREYQNGWWGDNRRRFETLAARSSTPMGLLAYAEDGTPIGWCATGPRSRFQRVIGPRSTILKARDPAEDDHVWLVPCFYVRVGHRRAGTTRALLAAAVELAATHGAVAVEGFPLAADNPGKADGYYGREGLFSSVEFECVDRPTPKRVVMRRQITHT
jgi:GNAT superfamily N-acetyltransferase